MKKQIDIKPKKPKLAYIGMDKKTLVEAVPTQVVEIVHPSKAIEQTRKLIGGKIQEALFGERQIGLQYTENIKEQPKNRLIWTNDNLVALKTLLDEKDSVIGEYKYRNKVDLIYIDPPFMVQDDFIAENSIDIEVDEEEGVRSVKEPTIIETIAYKDTWQNGLDSFTQMMRERLLLMKDLLSSTGLIYVHLDWHTSHYIKILMDEIFDYPNFRNEIIWHYYNKLQGNIGRFASNHDVIFAYKVSEKTYFESIKEEREEPKRQQKRVWDKETQSLIQARDENGNLIYYTETHRTIDDVWRIPYLMPADRSEKTGFPTQKPLELLTRIIKSSCPQGGLVLDAFVGSGTTCVAAEMLGNNWIGIDNSKFGIHTARKRLIELNGKLKGKKGEGLYKVRPFTVENMGYYQRGVKWDSIQVSNQADAYRQAIIELFGGEYAPYSKLLHGKKRGAWVHIGPLSTPLVIEQVLAVAEEVKETEFKKCYVLSADFTAHLNQAVEQAKEKFDVQIMTRIIPASAIEEVKKRLDLLRQGIKEPEQVNDMPNIAFFAPLAIKIHCVVDSKEVMVELSGLEVDAESFLESQKPERREELKKWLEQEKSWQSFVDFWAVDWDYADLMDANKEPIFENEWQSFRKRNGKKSELLVFKAFYTYEKPGEYIIAVKVTDVFGNDGIITRRVVVK